MTESVINHKSNQNYMMTVSNLKLTIKKIAINIKIIVKISKRRVYNAMNPKLPMSIVTLHES